MTYLLLTVRFLDDRYHGLLDRGGPSEWPPSPFRLFQALIAGVARRRELVEGEDVPSNTNFTNVGNALDWLQRHTREHPPIIIAPKSKTGQAITRFVPNNDGDKKFDRQERLTSKPTIPTLFLLESDQKPEVHYLWDISGATNCPEKDIRDAARALTTLGWGIDMAFADARCASESELQQLKGVRWYPKKNAGSFHDTLRVPTYDDETHECTLSDLRHCHSTFINRIEQGKPLKTVDKPKVFDRVLYTSTERPIGRPHIVFRLIDDEDEIIRPGYPHAKLIHIAGMVRHVALERMTRNPPTFIKDPAEWVNRVVRGKRDASTGDKHQQFSYVPLPSIGHHHSDALIRNVMVTAPLGMERELDYLAEQLNGQTLQPEGVAEPCRTGATPSLSQRIELQKFIPPRGKFIAERYLGTSAVWQTVTPVILDGHVRKWKERDVDGREMMLTDHVQWIGKALQRAGIETPCEFEWQAFPFFKNCLSAHKYDRNHQHTGYYRPNHLETFTAVHVRLVFRRPFVGPLAIGAGRHCGLGLFAAEAT